ncbi:cytochrome b/b6 domain-containing protein [Mucilaginibacter pedocola]|uniref:Ni,Fe-hydrogenase I cytochrome b subunit n=1 Tax=Mucilaginibacter pedocola TaxID=1792845 RepID=A0A1S9P6V9_9SPHI|nr:cytochrome b/b6 domain-containing protein [Mucilaginibacter pedocola]OOQ56692.1 Ni,Fe-hydrogenase I cytochrome b subunit [Mucilaginibacter pedocola]
MDTPQPNTLMPRVAKTYSAPLRAWHWLNMLVITGSLATVIINATITDDRANSTLIKTELQRSGAIITDDQARQAAHALGDSVWGIHIYFGYALTILLIARLVLEWFQLADQKLIRKVKTAYHQYKTVKEQRQRSRHEFAVKTLYAAFYLLLIIMAITGLFLAFEDALAAYRSIRHSVKEVHGFCMYLIIAFVIVHIAGVVIAEKTDSKGIVSDMINGGN